MLWIVMAMGEEVLLLLLHLLLLLLLPQGNRRRLKGWEEGLSSRLMRV